MIFHEKQWHFDFREYWKDFKRKEKEYKEMYYPKRPASWKSPPQKPNMLNGNMNSFHKDAPRYKKPDP